MPRLTICTHFGNNVLTFFVVAIFKEVNPGSHQFHSVIVSINQQTRKVNEEEQSQKLTILITVSMIMVIKFTVVGGGNFVLITDRPLLGNCLSGHLSGKCVGGIAGDWSVSLRS